MKKNVISNIKILFLPLSRLMKIILFLIIFLINGILQRIVAQA